MDCEKSIQGLEALDVVLYWDDVASLSPREQDRIQAMMSGREQKRWARIRHEPTRRCFLVTRRLLRTTLARLGGRSPDEWRFGIAEHGRPFLENPTDELAELDFNIAHSRHAVVLAIARGGRVGVDLEPVDRQIDYDLVAKQFFNPRERRALETLDDEARHRRFLALWVLKEAWMKADGRGIGAGLREVVVRFDDRAMPQLWQLPDDDADDWQILLRRVDGHFLAVARQVLSR